MIFEISSFQNIYETYKETGNWQINRKKASNSVSRGEMVHTKDKAAVINVLRTKKNLSLKSHRMCDDNVIPNRPSIKKYEVQKKLIKNSIPKNIKTETKKIG